MHCVVCNAHLKQDHVELLYFVVECWVCRNCSYVYGFCICLGRLWSVMLVSGGSALAPKVSCFSLAGVGIGIMCHALPFV